MIENHEHDGNEEEQHLAEQPVGPGGEGVGRDFAGHEHGEQQEHADDGTGDGKVEPGDDRLPDQPDQPDRGDLEGDSSAAGESWRG